MLRCSCCVMPATRPDSPFVGDLCPACVSYRKRPTIDWNARKAELIALLERHDGRCIVPSSGGKDSTYQVLTLLELGADVTVVTARTCHLTDIGRKNIDNLARYARTIEVVPNMAVRAKLNRLGLELVGDISHAEHMAIFSVPFQMAAHLGINLIMYGESPQREYGGPQGSEEAMQMTRRWVGEFGGLLGLRPSDFVGMEGITKRDMADYEPIWSNKVEAHFLGQYLPWSSRRNCEVAAAHGMIQTLPIQNNWLKGENEDNAQTGIHDYFMYLKYGFSRGCQQISVDVRAGHVTRDHALAWLEGNGNHMPIHYAGVSIHEVLDRIGMPWKRFMEVCDQFTNKEVHAV
jgi:hypothetical protein